MTESQLLALVSGILVLIIVLRSGRRLPREGLLWKTALWLAIFLAIGLFYSWFGPFENFG